MRRTKTSEQPPTKIYESSGSVHSNLVRELLLSSDIIEPSANRLVRISVDAAFDAARLYAEGWRVK